MENSNQGKKRSPPSTTFHFVTDQEPGQPSQVRRHAARERWKQRKASGLARFQRTRPRRLASASTAPEPTASAFDSDIAGDVIALPIGSSSEDVFVDIRHSLNKGPRKWTVSPIPDSRLRSPSPYQSLGYAQLDPFNVVRFSREDQELLYHWTNVYAYQAFGRPEETDPTYAPISNLFVPIHLSDEATTHATLAHSANHMAYIRGQPSPLSALSHKIASIKLVNEALNDPEIAVSDGTIAAVLRLATFERYWGTEDSWHLHQRGLSQLVKQRGGLNTLRGNWSLELRVLLAPLMARTQFTLDPANALIAKPHSKFLNLFSEIAVPGPDVVIDYPAIGRAIGFLKSTRTSHDETERPGPPQEIERLMCLVYVSLVFKRSQNSRSHVEQLNGFLERTEQVWFNSIPILRWLLIQNAGKEPDGLKDEERTERLAEAARRMNLSSPYSSVEERYLGILAQEPAETEGLL